MMKYYSYAGETRGTDDPEDIYAVHVEDDECDVDRCPCKMDHFVLMWSGNEYSKDHTWISASENDVVDLSEIR